MATESEDERLAKMKRPQLKRRKSETADGGSSWCLLFAQRKILIFKISGPE